MLANRLFGDPVRIHAFLDERLDGVDDLGPPAVVESDRQGQRAVVLGELDRLVLLTDQSFWDAPITAAGETDADTKFMQFVASVFEDRLVEAHQVSNFVDRPAPVLRAERKHGEPLDTQFERAVHRVEERLFARGMAIGPPQASCLGPAPVAVHHNRDVGGNALEVNTAHVHEGRRYLLPTGHGRLPPACSSTLGALTDLDVVEVLAAVVSAFPGGGEVRSGQQDMAAAVAAAIARHRHLVIQAGTGTGKSLGYLVPSILSGQRVVVATATKALQDQLATMDLPFLAQHLDRPFEFAVLKGRANYLCLQRLRELDRRAQGELDVDDGGPRVRRQVARLAAWATTTSTGDRAELDWEPDQRAWAAVSVSAAECPGATQCPMGDRCFTETARSRAAAADVVIVNLHLYGIDLATNGAILPEHDLVIIDEVHQLEDVVSDTNGLALGPGRFASLARMLRSIVVDEALAAAVGDAGPRLASALGPYAGQRLASGALPTELIDVIVLARGRVQSAADVLRAVSTSHDDVDQRRTRALKAASTLLDDLDAALHVPPTFVTWVEGADDGGRLMVAPLDVAPVLADALWPRRTAILTSATVPLVLPARIGLPEGEFDELDVGSPFDYETNALLYCAAHLPDPRREGFDAAVAEELFALITAAGGRTLALFTSWRAMTTASDALRPRLPFRLLTQAELPKPALLKAFRSDETSCVFATAGLFQGVDVPGASLSLVTLDRIPFARPDEPLWQARREQAGAAAFRVVDLPRAATLLAQASGRLIRRATDRGVVAVFDPRLATAGYRWDLVRALPPMRRTRRRDEAEAFLREIVRAR